MSELSVVFKEDHELSMHIMYPLLLVYDMVDLKALHIWENDMPKSERMNPHEWHWT
jgi:hypothetical protein